MKKNNNEPLARRVFLGRMAVLGGGGVVAAGALPATIKADPEVHVVSQGNVQDLLYNKTHIDAHGARGNGVDSDDAAMASAIASGAAFIELGEGPYRFNRPINLSLREESPIAIVGQGPASFLGTSNTRYASQVLGNTGSCVIEAVGSHRVMLKDFGIRVHNNLPDPSRVGIWIGRSERGHKYAEYHHYENLYISMDHSGDATVRGRIGIYNVAGEHFSMQNCYVWADAPYIFTDTPYPGLNTAPISGPLARSEGFATMTVVELINCGAYSQGAPGQSRYAYEFTGAQNVQMIGAYASRGFYNDSRFAMRFNQGVRRTRDIWFKGQVEMWEGIALLASDVDGLFLWVHKGHNEGYVPPRAEGGSFYASKGHVELQRHRLSSSHIQVYQGIESPVSPFHGAAGSEVAGTEVVLEDGQAIDAPNVRFRGTVRGKTPAGAIAVHADSNYVLIGDGVNHIYGDAELLKQGSGLIMRQPNGRRRRLVLDNNGNVGSEAV